MGSPAEFLNSVSEKVDQLLTLWANHMRRGSVGRGYPGKSLGLSTGGINCWDDIESEWDSQLASAVNTILNDLSGQHYCAISNVYCARVWQYRGEDLEVFPVAILAFERKAQAAGLL